MENNIIEAVCRKVKISDAEMRQGSAFADWAERTGQHPDLIGFLRKSIANSLADNIADGLEAERREEYEERIRPLIYT